MGLVRYRLGAPVTPARLMSRPVTLRVAAAGAVDEYGNPTDTYTPTSTVGEVQQSQRNDRTDDQHTQDETWRLFLPPSTPLTGWDQVAIDGATFEVVGPPWPAINPRTGAASHVEATIRRTV